jgi:hypothetical protein
MAETWKEAIREYVDDPTEDADRIVLTDEGMTVQDFLEILYKANIIGESKVSIIDVLHKHGWATFDRLEISRPNPKMQ